MYCAVWWAEPVDGPGLRDLLDPAERQRYEGYRQEVDRRRFVTGRALAKQLVAERLGGEVAAVHFDASCADCAKQHGPPRVPGAALALSISHAGDRVGVAITDGAAVGLDVETTSRKVEQSLIDYALNETERAALAGLPEQRRAAGFFAYWTRKEAAMKATGRGLRIPVRSLTFAPPDEPARLLASADAGLTPAGVRMADLDPGPGHRAALAVLGTGELRVAEHRWHPAQT